MVRASVASEHRQDVQDDQLADKDDRQQQDHRRNVDTAEIGQEPPDRPERGLRQIVENPANGIDDLIARIDDIEGIEPGEDRAGDDHIRVEFQGEQYHVEECGHGPVRCRSKSGLALM